MNRALYSASSGRALYSASSGRGLYGSYVDLTPTARYKLGTGEAVGAGNRSGALAAAQTSLGASGWSTAAARASGLWTGQTFPWDPVGYASATLRVGALTVAIAAAQQGLACGGVSGIAVSSMTLQGLTARLCAYTSSSATPPTPLATISGAPYAAVVANGTYTLPCSLTLGAYLHVMAYFAGFDVPASASAEATLTIAGGLSGKLRVNHA